jgi:hypothetical protein
MRIIMYQDEIINEVWKNREAYARRHNHNLHEIVLDLQKRQQNPLSCLVSKKHQISATKEVREIRQP